MTWRRMQRLNSEERREEVRESFARSSAKWDAGRSERERTERVERARDDARFRKDWNATIGGRDLIGPLKEK